MQTLSWQSGGGEDAAETQINLIDFKNGPQFLPPPLLSRQPRRDAFEAVGNFYSQFGTVNRNARITGVGELVRRRPHRLAIRRTYTQKQVDLYGEDEKAKLNFITSADVGRVLKNVYGEFRASGLIELGRSAGKTRLTQDFVDFQRQQLKESVKAIREDMDRTLYGREHPQHPQQIRDRLAGRTWSFYGVNPEDDLHGVDEATAREMMQPAPGMPVGFFRGFDQPMLGARILSHDFNRDMYELEGQGLVTAEHIATSGSFWRELPPTLAGPNG